MEQHKREGLYNALNALYGHDLASAQRELDWVENHLDESTDMPEIAQCLREIVDRLKCLDPSQ